MKEKEWALHLKNDYDKSNFGEKALMLPPTNADIKKMLKEVDYQLLQKEVEALGLVFGKITEVQAPKTLVFSTMPSLADRYVIVDKSLVD